MRVLLERGADINQGAHDGYTPLYIASQEGHEEVVRVLLERGADINVLIVCKILCRYFVFLC